VLSAVVLVAGILLRAYHLIQQRSMWIDEARLALNLQVRGYLELLHPLAYDQSAPPGFLWAVRSLILVFGGSEWVLRLLPFAAGVAALLVFRQTTDQLLASPAARLAAVAWVALGPQFIFYSDELKPYGVDLLVNVLATWATLSLVTRPSAPSRKAMLWLTGLAIVAPWVSTPTIFTLAAAAIAIILHDRSAAGEVPRRPLLAWTLGALSTACASVLVFRVTGTRVTGSGDYLRQYWGEALVRIAHPGALARLGFGLQDIVSGTFLGIVRQGLLEADLRTAVLAFTVLLIPLVGLGWLSIAKRHGVAVGVLISGPPLLATAASLLGYYPLAFRLMLFGTPAMVWGLAAGLETAIEGRLRWRSWTWAIAAVVLFEVPLERDFNDLTSLPARDNVRAAAAFVRQAAGKGESIYVLPGGLPAWVYYTTDWSHPDTPRLRLAERMASSGGAAFENEDASRLKDAPDSLLEAWLGDHNELWGRASGVQFRQGTDSLDTRSAGRWAEREAGRIRRAGHVVWILVSFTPPYASLLFERLREQGGRLHVAYHTEDILVVRCAFAELD
jgi:hypothetical protein